jgi:hypothetical protein
MIANVGDDHDGGFQPSPGRTYRPSQDLRVRLLCAESVLTADRSKAVGEP